MDPERGALIYRKTTQVQTIEPETEFGPTKRIKKVTSETSWMGGQGAEEKRRESLATLAEADVQPFHSKEIEENPLYSAGEYTTDFSNPLYANRLSSAAEGAAIVPPDTAAAEGDDKAPLIGGRAARGRRPGSGDKGKEYVDYLSGVPDYVKADTLY